MTYHYMFWAPKIKNPYFIRLSASEMGKFALKLSNLSQNDAT